jgi:NADH-quinone oxidoreductase subunit E
MESNRINATIRRHHFEKHDLKAILLDLQDQGIPLTKDVLQSISDAIQVPLARIYGLVTFYDAFRFEEKGREPISVCHGLACQLQGGEKLSAQIESLVKGEKKNEPRLPLYVVKKVYCLGCCAAGPNVMVHDRVYSQPNARTLGKIVRQESTEDGHENQNL